MPDQAVLKEIMPPEHKKGMIQNMMRFCDALRKEGTEIAIGEVIDALRGLLYINFVNKEIFYFALRTTLIKKKEDLEIFDKIFLLFWRITDSFTSPLSIDSSQEPSVLPTQRETRLLLDQDEGEEDTGQEQTKKYVAYSPVEILAKKDLTALQANEVHKINRLISIMSRKMATDMGRRKQASRVGHIDFSKTMRINMQYGGELLKIARRKGKVTKAKLCVICDVSGSMQMHSKFIVQFLYGLRNVFGKVDIFVFSTRLTRVTDHFKKGSFHEALDRVSRLVLDWGGGTNIGSCLESFNNRFANSLLDEKTVVLIASDGWDTGEIELLDREMRKIKMKANKVVWLNPLMSRPGYMPIQKGMKTALPYIDVFAGVNNLKSLKSFVKTLKPVMRSFPKSMPKIDQVCK